jgi:2-polyprenyl-3-methyl-5-hydroxy-6-metoxy-1,4-benzoquinol methylase
MKELKQVSSCPACGSEQSEHVLQKDVYSLKKCTGCGLIYLTPIPHNINRIYTDDISSSTTSYYKLSEKIDTEVFSGRLEELEKYTSKGNILDIGCNIGTFLKTAKSRGWNNILGIEPNPAAANICKENNIPVINDFFNHETAEKYSGFFNAVNMGDVIEHLEKPCIERYKQSIKTKRRAYDSYSRF